MGFQAKGSMLREVERLNAELKRLDEKFSEATWEGLVARVDTYARLEPKSKAGLNKLLQTYGDNRAVVVAKVRKWREFEPTRRATREELSSYLETHVSRLLPYDRAEVAEKGIEREIERIQYDLDAIDGKVEALCSGFAGAFRLVEVEDLHTFDPHEVKALLALKAGFEHLRLRSTRNMDYYRALDSYQKKLDCAMGRLQELATLNDEVVELCVAIPQRLASVEGMISAGQHRDLDGLKALYAGGWLEISDGAHERVLSLLGQAGCHYDYALALVDGRVFRGAYAEFLLAGNLIDQSINLLGVIAQLQRNTVDLASVRIPAEFAEVRSDIDAARQYTEIRRHCTAHDENLKQVEAAQADLDYAEREYAKDTGKRGIGVIWEALIETSLSLNTVMKQYLSADEMEERERRQMRLALAKFEGELELLRLYLAANCDRVGSQARKALKDAQDDYDQAVTAPSAVQAWLHIRTGEGWVEEAFGLMLGAYSGSSDEAGEEEATACV